jgi:predicted transcriptional regulator
MGFSVKQVAEKMDCSDSTVNKVLRAHGLKSRGNSKQVNQYDMQGGYLRTFDSTK